MHTTYFHTVMLYWSNHIVKANVSTVRPRLQRQKASNRNSEGSQLLGKLVSVRIVQATTDISEKLVEGVVQLGLVLG
jgi:hypothetical protein